MTSFNPIFTIKKNQEIQHHPAEILENGQVLFLVDRDFDLYTHESCIFSKDIIDPKEKNISYDFHKNHISGIAPHLKNHDHHTHTKQMMHRYVEYCQNLIEELIPEYKDKILVGRTSYRPIEVTGRSRSIRQDDTRLHIDAFQSSPTQGHRILRVFCNINPHNKPRIWHIGEPFEKVLNYFKKRLTPYFKPGAIFLYVFTITKKFRTEYDHLMLKLHNKMKRDKKYQAKADFIRFEFPAKSTWIVFTDQVSHAALGGQYLLEQTFYLPVEAMNDPTTSPLAQLRKIKSNSKLI